MPIIRKIQSSKRITKSLMKAISSGKGVPFKFDDGTQASLEPALARRAMAYYNKLSSFEQAQAAKKMRSSFKIFLQIIRGN